jgi:hypothetical protein
MLEQMVALTVGIACELGVCLFYVSPSEESVFPPDTCEAFGFRQGPAGSQPYGYVSALSRRCATRDGDVQPFSWRGT